MRLSLPDMSVKLGSLRIEISYPLAAAMALVLIYDKSMSAALCFLAVLVHESGHLFFLHRFGAFPRAIRLTLFDIAIVDRKKPLRSVPSELAVTLGGIGFNLAAAVLSIIAGAVGVISCAYSFAAANLSLAVFNSLPADSLDGGQALFLLLCQRFSPDRAFLILDIISFSVLIPCCVAGFMLLLRSCYNFSLLLSSLYLIALILIRRKGLPV